MPQERTHSRLAHLLPPPLGHPGCEIRLHDTTLYNSIFRDDDHLLVNPHIWGQPASANPLFQLRRTANAEWFNRYNESFEAVWKTARHWAPDNADSKEYGRSGQD